MSSQKSTIQEGRGVCTESFDEVESLNLSMKLEESDGAKIEQYNISSFPNKDVWNIFGYAIPKQEVMFFSQIFALYIVIIIGLINITLQNENSNLWLSLLSGSIGYLLPNPSLKKETIILRHSVES